MADSDDVLQFPPRGRRVQNEASPEALDMARRLHVESLALKAAADTCIGIAAVGVAVQAKSVVVAKRALVAAAIRSLALEDDGVAGAERYAEITFLLLHAEDQGPPAA
jgi:hypothetical protein